MLPRRILLATLLMTAVACTETEKVYIPVRAVDAPHVDGEVVVRYSPALTREDVEARVSTWGATVSDDLGANDGSIEAIALVDGTWRIALPAGTTVGEALLLLEAEDDIEFAEPNYIVEAFRTPNDPDFGQLWGLPRIGAPQAWESTTGSEDVVVGVIDTGVLHSHPDLIDNMWVNADEIPGNGVDDDDNGYVDDVYGWDFCNNDSDPVDDHFHGTHCAGTIAGTGDNAIGVTGVAWTARIMALKFLCANGSGNTVAAGNAVRYAADNGATFTSNSWGGGGYSNYLYASIEYARSKDQLFVAAAGNNGQNADQVPMYPAAYDLDNIISVAASDSSDRRAGFSNYGRSRVDVAAPGVSIYSTTLGNGYRLASGTSMAAPHVAGAVALYYARSPAATWEGARDAVFETVDPVPAWRDVVATGGRINVARMLESVAEPPPVVRDVTAEPEGGSGIRVRWTPSPDDTVQRYNVYLRAADADVLPAHVVEGRNTAEVEIFPVEAGIWFISVSAVGLGGEGDRSVEVRVDVVDETPPAAILDVTAVPQPGTAWSVAATAATSRFADTWGSANLLDEDPTTGWAALPMSQPEAERVTLDLGAVRAVGEIALRGVVGFDELFPPGVEIRLSTEPDDWTVVAREIAAPPAEASTWRRWQFVPTEARFVDIVITEPARHPSGLFYAALGDVRVSAPPDSVGALLIGWTAPGDDAMQGRAAEYDLRVGTFDGEGAPAFDDLPGVEAPAPAEAGTREATVVDGLLGHTDHWVAITARDEAGNTAEPSPPVRVRTGSVAPGGIDDLEGVPGGPGKVELAFTAPADDGHRPDSGAVARYDIRVSDQRIEAATWPEALSVEGPVPAAPGTREQFPLDGLPFEGRIFVRIAAVDAAGLRGPWSESIKIDTPRPDDATPPATVDDLNAVYVSADAEPLPMAAQDLAQMPLVDGDPATGWLAELPADDAEPLDLVFDWGEQPRPLTRVMLLPHLLYPGDLPPDVEVLVPDAGAGGLRPVARSDGHAVVPGQWMPLDFAPIDATGFVLRLHGGVERFGVTAVALGEVQALAAPPGGGAARLTWVAPGDDGYDGSALRYDIRRAEAPIADEAAFMAAAPAGAEAPDGEAIEPGVGGDLEIGWVRDLPEGRSTWFALRAVDIAGNWSGVSNTVEVDVPPIRPSTVVDLTAIDAGRDFVVVQFTAPGDDGSSGTATEYELRYTDGPLDAGSFAAATRAPTGQPLEGGEIETIRIEGLDATTEYRFALIARDESGGASDLSNVAVGSTLEGIPPASIRDLRVQPGETPSSAVALWTAVGDDGDAGRAAGYDLRWHTAPIDDANFGEATPVDLAGVVPGPPGAPEGHLIETLPGETDLWFAVVAVDEVPNRSPLSNVVAYTTPDVPPDPVVDLRVNARTNTSITLTWTATGDDGRSGTAAEYDLRMSDREILTDQDFLAADRIVIPAPVVAGRLEAFEVQGLPEGSRHHFALVVIDDAGNRSHRSASIIGDTTDAVPPEAVVDLEASAQVGDATLPLQVRDASSEHSPAASAANLVDEDPASIWLSALRDAPTEEFAEIDLGGARHVYRIRLRAAADYAAYFPPDYVVEARVGGAWEPVVDEREVAREDDAWFERSFAPVEADRLRIRAGNVPAEGGGHLLAIGGFEAFQVDPGAVSVLLQWTSPVDSGPLGRAARYDIRRDVVPITIDTFADATRVPGPTPAPAGLPHRFTAGGLEPETAYWFALVPIDEAGNRGPISNVAQATTLGVPPGTVLDLEATAVTREFVELTWTAPGADGQDGQASAYDLRRADAPLTPETFDGAIPLDAPVPAPAGEAQTVRIEGLEPSTTYRFGLKASDENGLWSGLSNVVVVRTPDPPERIPPARIDDLLARTIFNIPDQVLLSWTAPGDDGMLGQAAEYDVRWSLDPMPDDAAFDAGVPVAGIPNPLPGGFLEFVAVDGFPREVPVWFAVVTIDDEGNRSPVSNGSRASSRPEPPAMIDDLALEIAPEGDRATMTWTAPGDDGNEGSASAYEIFLSRNRFVSPIGLDPIAGPAPRPAGSNERFDLVDLERDITWWVAVRAVDDAGNAGELSTVVPFTLPDNVPPGPVEGLAARSGEARGTIVLEFTSPGDDGVAGRPAAYEIWWAEAAFDAADFAQQNRYEGFLATFPGGADARVTLGGLPDERPLHFALRGVDNGGNTGPISAVVNARTPDVIPGRVGDLLAESAGADRVRLSWTAPGDDGDLGRASAYAIRQAEIAISIQNWDQAQPVQAMVPAPAEPGSRQSVIVNGLDAGTVYHFALRAIDDRGNQSDVSNSARTDTDDITPPAQVRDVEVSTPRRGQTLQIGWRATGDDGDEGRPVSYEIRAATLPWPGFDNAPFSTVAPATADAGQPQSAVMTGLAAEQQYAVAIVAIDDGGNRSQPSVVQTGWTAAIAPGVPSDVRVSAAGPGALEVTFTAPADNAGDNGSGPVARYEVAVADASFTPLEFDAQPREAGPVPVGPGLRQTHRIEGLANDTDFWVSVRAIDDRDALSDASDVVQGRTADAEPPAGIATLVAQGPRRDGDPLPVRSAFSTATLSEEWPAVAAFDRDLDSAWAAPTGAEALWVSARLRSAASVGGVRLRAGEFVDRFPTAFSVLLDDVEVATVRDLDPGAHAWVELSFEPTVASEVRIEVLEAGGNGAFAVINEIEVLPADDPPDTVSLSWVAPGDDRDSGQAESYEVRYSDAPVNAGNFAQGTAVEAPVPGPAGTPETLRVTGLDEETEYWFGVVAIDDAGNRSAVSNIARATTAGVPPARVDDLAAAATGADSVRLTWTAPGADGDAGQAARYELRYRVDALSEATWEDATPVDLNAPAPAGTPESVEVDGLLPGTAYAFALRAYDARDNVSLLSEVAFALTQPAPDVVPPSEPGNLKARLARGLEVAIVGANASASQFPDFPQVAAIDGDFDSAWASPARDAEGTETLVLSLREAATVDHLRLRPHPDFPDLFPKEMRVEASIGNNQWQVVAEVNGQGAPPGWADIVFEPTPLTSLRLTPTRGLREDVWLVMIAEVEAYESAEPGTATLSFTAPGDDGDVGTADRYVVARSAQPIHAGNWADAVQTDADTVPAPAGAPQAIVVRDIPDGVWFLAVRAVDEVGNFGAISASAQVQLP